VSKIAIMTDTDSSIATNVAAQFNIYRVPINIHFGQNDYQDGIDIDNAQIFARIDREGKLPQTAAPSPGKFVEAFQTAFSAGAESIICFCVSSEVSATYSAAVAARDTLPDRDITVVDTNTLCANQAFMVISAVEAVKTGASKDEVIARALDTRDRAHLYASLATLKYLAMSGRVGHLAAGVAGLLNVKPILTIRNGKLDMLEKVRTRSKAWDRTIELLVESAGGKAVERMSILHVNALAEAQMFEKQLRASMSCPETIDYVELNPGLSIHSGALMGAAFVSAK
jgi:DegV family protein with EDD domain